MGTPPERREPSRVSVETRDRRLLEEHVHAATGGEEHPAEQDGTNDSTDGDTATVGLDSGSDTAAGSGKITVSKGNVSIVYTVKGKTVTLTKVTAKGSTVKIPVTVEENGKTYKVTKIAPNAFKGNKKIKKVVIGGNVTQIGKKAFAGCSGVKKVVIDAKSLKKVGKKAFSGIPENAVIKIKGNAKQKAKAQKLISRSF